VAMVASTLEEPTTAGTLVGITGCDSFSRCIWRERRFFKSDLPGARLTMTPVIQLVAWKVVRLKRSKENAEGEGTDPLLP
jgi:hypothetical protein